MKKCAQCDHDYDDAHDGCPVCARHDIPVAASTSAGDLSRQQGDQVSELDRLAARVDEAERLLNSSNVYHFNFWPRALAIYGHMLAIGVFVFVVVFVVAGAMGFFGAFLGGGR